MTCSVRRCHHSLPLRVRLSLKPPTLACHLLSHSGSLYCPTQALHKRGGDTTSLQTHKVVTPAGWSRWSDRKMSESSCLQESSGHVWGKGYADVASTVWFGLRSRRTLT